MDHSADKSGMHDPPPYTGPPPTNGHPMPPSEPQPQQSPTTVTATVIPGVMPMVIEQQMSPTPTRITCQSCNMEIVTRVERKPTLRTHLFAALLCFIGFWPCAFVPYVMKSCNNADHYCPNCNSYIGSYVSLVT